MTVENADDAREVFKRSSMTVEEILEHVEHCARDNMRYAPFEGWPSDEVVKELKKRGFKVVLNDFIMPDMKVYW